MTRSPFFEGITQAEVTVAGRRAAVPTFFYDASAMTAVFAGRYGALRSLLPDPRFVPARLAPGLGLVALTAIEYRQTDVGPYNELAVSIVLKHPPFGLNVPGRAMVGSWRRRQYHAYVHRLPVTSEVALLGGEFSGFPKVIADIEFTDGDGGRVCRVAEGANHILTLRAKPIATPRSEQLQAFIHLWMDRQPQCVELRFNAVEFGDTLSPRAASLDLSPCHPMAAELAELLAWRRPVLYRYVRRLEGIEFGPEHHTLPLLLRARELIAGARLVDAGNGAEPAAEGAEPTGERAERSLDAAIPGGRRR